MRVKRTDVYAPHPDPSPRVRSEGTSIDRFTLETLMLYTIVVIMLALWLLGFALDLVGGLIHILLVIAAVVLVYQFVTGKKRV